MVPGRAPVLLVGNEGEAYAKVVPDGVQVVRYQSFSLVSQDRSASPRLDAVLRSAGLGAAGLGDGVRRTGIAGWKYFGPAEADHLEQWIDAPAFIVDEIRALGCQPVNATGLFTAPGRGLRLINDADQLACFEFAASHGSESMRRMLHHIRPGLTEIAAFSLFEPTGLPYSYHPTMLSGERAASESDLPEAASDYLDRLVAPYYACAAEWYETIGIGVTGGEPFEVARRHLADPFFGVHLNPGHFIHLDKWPSSPVYAGSDVVLTSGMALQLDIIPATGTAYHTSNIEDGVVLADQALHAELADRYPGLGQRVAQRRAFMADALGIRLKPEVLPLSNQAGYLPPLWLAPHLAMRRK